MSASPSFSLVLPCRNQADHIGRVLEGYLAALEPIGVPFELVVVPNACTDRTPEIVAELARQDRRIQTVANPLGGWGRSVLAGLRAARGAVLAYTNTARTDPARVPELYELYCRNPESMVKLCRVKRQAPLRQIGSRLYNLEGRLLLGVRSNDVNGTPKIFSRDFYRQADAGSEDDLLDMEFMARAAQLGVPVVEVPVPGFRRHGGRSSTTLRSAWLMYTGAWRLRRRLAARKAA